MDIFCDEDGVPCLLKTVFETIGGKPYHQNGVRIHDFLIFLPVVRPAGKRNGPLRAKNMPSIFGTVQTALLQMICRSMNHPAKWQLICW